VTQNHKQIANLLNGAHYVDANFLQATGDLMVHQSSNNFKHDKIDTELRCQDAVQQLQSRLVSAESQRVIPCSASTTKGIISENTYHCSMCDGTAITRNLHTFTLQLQP